MKNNKILVLGVLGMAFFCLLQLILIFTKAPNVTPTALKVGFVGTGLITLIGIIKGISKTK